MCSFTVLMPSVKIYDGNSHENKKLTGSVTSPKFINIWATNKSQSREFQLYQVCLCQYWLTDFVLSSSSFDPDMNNVCRLSGHNPFYTLLIKFLKQLHNVSYLNFDLLVTEQRNQMRDDTGVNDHLDLLVPSVRQIRQSPHRVYQDLKVAKRKNEWIHFSSRK